METVTSLITSLVEYFTNFNWDEALNSIKMIIENFDTQLIEDTFKSLIDLIESIF